MFAKPPDCPERRKERIRMNRHRKEAACQRTDTHSIAGMLREGEILKEELPYEKFERLGPGALSDAELLAIIIRTGSGGLTPTEIGWRILHAGKEERGLAGLNHLSLTDLQRIPGIGHVKAVKLKCITELSQRMSEARTRPGLCFTSPKKVAAHYMERLRHKDREEVLLLTLNARMALIAESVVSTGTVSRAMITPREIYQTALGQGASSIILMHNHPGGDPAPSNDDIELTAKVEQAGDVLCVRLADHLIIGDGCYFSFRQHRLLKNYSE